jgi:hypothetical protein
MGNEGKRPPAAKNLFGKRFLDLQKLSKKHRYAKRIDSG